MASNFAIHKVVNTLPGSLESNCLYLVRAGDGFDLYGTTSAGVAVPLNQPQLHQSHWAGRFYCHTNNRWVGWHANYGPNNQNWNSNAGTGAEPTSTFTRLGMNIAQGAVMSRVRMAGRVNNAEVTGFDFRVVHDTGPFGTWNSNAGTTRTTLFSANGLTFSGANVQTQFEFDLSAAAAIPADGYIKCFFRPTGTITGTHNFFNALSVDYFLPQTGLITAAI
jgi:hypothetical protein